MGLIKGLAQYTQVTGQLAAIQKKILQNALVLLVPGGKLLYCTCTVEPEENRLLAEEVLTAHPDCRKGKLALPPIRQDSRDWDSRSRDNPDLDKLSLDIPYLDKPSLEKSGLDNPVWDGRGWDNPGWDIQLLPFVHGLEGFYMALITKEADAGV